MQLILFVTCLTFCCVSSIFTTTTTPSSVDSTSFIAKHNKMKQSTGIQTSIVPTKPNSMLFFKSITSTHTYITTENTLESIIKREYTPTTESFTTTTKSIIALSTSDTNSTNTTQEATLTTKTVSIAGSTAMSESSTTITGSVTTEPTAMPESTTTPSGYTMASQLVTTASGSTTTMVTPKESSTTESSTITSGFSISPATATTSEFTTTDITSENTTMESSTEPGSTTTMVTPIKSSTAICTPTTSRSTASPGTSLASQFTTTDITSEITSMESSTGSGSTTTMVTPTDFSTALSTTTSQTIISPGTTTTSEFTPENTTVEPSTTKRSTTSKFNSALINVTISGIKPFMTSRSKTPPTTTSSTKSTRIHSRPTTITSLGSTTTKQSTTAKITPENVTIESNSTTASNTSEINVTTEIQTTMLSTSTQSSLVTTSTHKACIVMNATIRASVSIEETRPAEMFCDWRTNGECQNYEAEWKRDNIYITDGIRIQVVTTHSLNKTSSRLILLNVNSRDTGQFICSLGGVEKKINTTVLETPRVTISPLSITVEEHSSINITCNITNPYRANVSSANVIWCVNGILLTGSAVESNHRQSVLMLRDLAISETVYTCGVHREKGTDAKCSMQPQSRVLVYKKAASVCNAEFDGHIDWETTPVNTEQIHPCRKGYEGIARRFCDSNGKWSEPNLLDCVKTVINKAIKSLEELKEGEGKKQEVIDVVLSSLITTTETGTENSDNKLSSGDLSKTSEALDTMLSIANDSVSSVAINETTFVGVLDNLLSVNNSDTWQNVHSKSNKSASRIMKTVENLGKVIAKSLEKDKEKLIKKDNIEIKILKTAKPVSFSPEQTGNDRQQSILLEKEGEKVFTAALYRTIANVLPGGNVNGQNHVSVSSEVLALDIVTNVSVSNTAWADHNNPVILVFETKRYAKENNLTEYKRSCVWWDFELNNSIGGWSKEGCQTFHNSCQCFHLTNFAVLMSPVNLLSEKQSKQLRIISLIGCCVSILSTISTIVVFLRVWRYVASSRSKLLLNLCAALTVAYILFVAGIDKTENDNACTAVTALMHYFFLSAFCLMLAEGIDILISVVVVFSTSSKLKWLLLIGWGTPAIVVSVTVGTSYSHEYHSQYYCWLTLTNGVLYSFVIPVIAIIIINFIVLVSVLRALYSTKLVMSRTRKQKVVAGIRSVCILLPVLGITWLFGIMSVNDDLIVFQYLFAVTNSFQGLFIFLFYVVFNKQVRHAIHEKVRRYEMRTQSSRLLSRENKQVSKSHSRTEYNGQNASQPTQELSKQYKLYGHGIPRTKLNVGRMEYQNLDPNKEVYQSRL